MANYRDWFKGKDYQVGQDVNSMTPHQIEDAIGVFGSHENANSRGAWNWLQKLQAKHYANQAAAKTEEYQRSMLEMYSRMAEAAEKPPVYQQPINDVSAANAYDKAERSTSDQQLMRRGILSLTRFGDDTRKRQTSGVA